jgi:hypothetical protein
MVAMPLDKSFLVILQLFCLHGSNAIGQEFPSYITYFVAFCHFLYLRNTFGMFLLTG